MEGLSPDFRLLFRDDRISAGAVVFLQMEAVTGSNCGMFHLSSMRFTKWTLHSCIASAKLGSFM